MHSTPALTPTPIDRKALPRSTSQVPVERIRLFGTGRLPRPFRTRFPVLLPRTTGSKRVRRGGVEQFRGWYNSTAPQVGLPVRGVKVHAERE